MNKYIQEVSGLLELLTPAEELPEHIIQLAAHEDLTEIWNLKNKMHPYLKLVITENNNKYCLYLIYDINIRCSK